MTGVKSRKGEIKDREEVIKRTGGRGGGGDGEKNDEERSERCRCKSSDREIIKSLICS